MKIEKITNQLGNDLYGVLVCESCGSTQKLIGGYDDANYHNNVMPTIKCKTCGKSRVDLEQVA